mgnify:CR=1 FL=1
MKKLKIYLDTSILSFVFADDAPEYKSLTCEFFDQQVMPGHYDVYISKIVIDEIDKTSSAEKKAGMLSLIEKYRLNILPLDKQEEIATLASHYLKAKIVPANKLEDALHVAYAVIYDIDILVSWNFKHLANLNKERGFNRINLEVGYKASLRLGNLTEVLGDE